MSSVADTLPQRRLELAFVGGGVAGLAGCLAAARAGFRASVFERAERSRDGGGPLWLPANAVRSLKTLGAFDGIRHCTTELRRYIVLDTQRRTVFSLPLDVLEAKYGEALHVVPRRELLQTLLAQLPDDSVFYQHDCVGVRQWHAGVTPIFDSKSAFESPLQGHLFSGLVGADGFHSKIRQRFESNRALEPVGGWIWTGLSKMSPHDGRRPGEAELIIGEAQTFLSLPLRQHAATPSQVVAWWAASASAQASSKYRLPQLGEGIRDILERTMEGSTMEFAIRDRPMAGRWSEGRVTLLGDAAHPMTPALGQGASQALEGAVFLGKCLAQHRPDVTEAFRHYEAHRRDRVARVVRFARYLGAGLTLPLPAALRRMATWSALPFLFGELDFMLRQPETRP